MARNLYPLCQESFVLGGSRADTLHGSLGEYLVTTLPRTLYKDVGAVSENKMLFELKAKPWKTTYGSCDAAKRPKFKDERKDSPRNILIEGVPVDEILDLLLKVQIRNIADSIDVAATALSLVKHKEDKQAALVDVVLVL